MYIDISKYNWPRYREQQLNTAIFKDFVSSFDEISTLPKSAREELKRDFRFPSIHPLLPISKKVQVTKQLFQASDGQTFEDVLLMHLKDRNTVCISCQIGCPMGCSFCATGQLGFIRNLTSQEIVDQVLYFSRILKDQNKTLTNIVFMGMGEPFLNIKNVENSIEILTGQEYMNMSPRRITISSVGVIAPMKEFFQNNPQINLALSIHSAEQDVREDIIPYAKQTQLDEIRTFLKGYLRDNHRRATLEYIMLKDVNDGQESIDALIDFVRSIDQRLILVNLIPYNDIENKIYEPSSKQKIIDIKNYLQSQGINTTIRKSLGQEKYAACGMLKKKIS